MNIPIGENEVRLCGKVSQCLQKSHVSRGRVYYSLSLDVGRLSGAVDRPCVVLPEERIPEHGVNLGDCLYISGQLRSFNNKSGEGRRLLISVYAIELEAAQSEEDINQVKLMGVICKQPMLRQTPLGREICDVMLAVNRHYGRADYLPVILWGQMAREVSQLTIGNQIRIIGRIQSRTYIKTIGTEQVERVAYEVSAIEYEQINTNSP